MLPFAELSGTNITTRGANASHATTHPNSGSLNDLGLGLPGCGRGVIVPANYTLQPGQSELLVLEKVVHLAVLQILQVKYSESEKAYQLQQSQILDLKVP